MYGLIALEEEWVTIVMAGLMWSRSGESVGYSYLFDCLNPIPIKRKGFPRGIILRTI